MIKIDWDNMHDIRIVHDRVGAFADWIVVSGHAAHDYVIGKLAPNYPLPAIRKTEGLIECERLCFICGSINGLCNRYPQDCLEPMIN
jgi:hypothetical protein